MAVPPKVAATNSSASYQRFTIRVKRKALTNVAAHFKRMPAMTRFCSDDHERLHQAQTTLLATDDKGSVLAELTENQARSTAYSAYGHQPTQDAVTARLGFNGELQEARLGWYFLGNGYRVYNPELMRFHSPDSWSPFGKGGLNAYMYCTGDPVNFSDPTGHVGFFTKLLTRFRRSTRASSTSSSVPLVPASEGRPITNRLSVDTGRAPRQTKSTINELAHTNQPTQKTNVSPFINSEVPPPRPPKSRPRFVDSGGLALESHLAPIPPSRKLASGAKRQYSVSYDKLGNPTQSSVEMVKLGNFTQSSVETALLSRKNRTIRE
jgi:RHS repeat-associated protein